jgi:hypothetical protein
MKNWLILTISALKILLVDGQALMTLIPLKIITNTMVMPPNAEDGFVPMKELSLVQEL